MCLLVVLHIWRLQHEHRSLTMVRNGGRRMWRCSLSSPKTKVKCKNFATWKRTKQWRMRRRRKEEKSQRKIVQQQIRRKIFGMDKKVHAIWDGRMGKNLRLQWQWCMCASHHFHQVNTCDLFSRNKAYKMFFTQFAKMRASLISLLCSILTFFAISSIFSLVALLLVLMPHTHTV